MWREVSRLRRGDYRFDLDAGATGEESAAEGQNIMNDKLGGPGGRGRRRAYTWKRDTESFSKTVYRCVDDEGRVVASLLSGGMLNWRKGGEIEIAEDVVNDQGFEELLITGAAAIFYAEAGWSVRQGYKSGSGSGSGSASGGGSDKGGGLVQ